MARRQNASFSEIETAHHYDKGSLGASEARNGKGTAALNQKSVFLTAEWRDLIMVNYAIDPRLLEPLVPAGLELDFHDNRTFISLVAFQFLDVRVRGFAIPWHRNFNEINLRFYVRRRVAGEWRRGVVFIKEFAPRWAVCAVANAVFRENYQLAPIRDCLEISDSTAAARYEWRVGGQWMHVAMQSNEPWRPMEAGSEEEFIAEHYWGYASGAATREYAVEHPRWRHRSADRVDIHCDVERVYGDHYVETMQQAPTSVFLADGSPITVRSASRLS